MFVSKQLKCWFMFSCSNSEPGAVLSNDDVSSGPQYPWLLAPKVARRELREKSRSSYRNEGLGKVSYVISLQVSYLHDLHVFHIIYMYISSCFKDFQGFDPGVDFSSSPSRLILPFVSLDVASLPTRRAPSQRTEFSQRTENPNPLSSEKVGTVVVLTIDVS